MGKDAEQSRRGWRRHLADVARADHARTRGDAEPNLFFSARELGTLAVNFIEWALYVFLTWGMIYLVLTDRFPKVAQAHEPMYWLDQGKVAGYVSDRSQCLKIVEDVSLPDGQFSGEYQRGFEAALQVSIGRLEQP